MDIKNTLESIKDDLAKKKRSVKAIAAECKILEGQVTEDYDKSIFARLSDCVSRKQFCAVLSSLETDIIIKPSKNNAIARRARKRGAIIEARREKATLARKLNNAFTKLSEGCNKRVFNAVTNAKDKQKEAVESIKRRNPVYYRNANPLGNKIHAVQRANFTSKPPVKWFL